MFYPSKPGNGAMMSLNQLHGLVLRHSISTAELSDIQRLTATCDAFEHLHLRLSWHLLQSRPGIEVFDFLYYEDGHLIGYLMLEDSGLEEKEVIVMVHPRYRRQGIFRSLLSAAAAESKLLGTKRFVLICEPISQSGQACARAIKVSRDFSEHEMFLASFHPSHTFDDRLHLRPAALSDLDVLIAIQSASFGDLPDVVRHRLLRRFQDPTTHFYLATLGDSAVTCQEPVGSLRLHYCDDSIGIYGFGVLPAYQGRGYGRQILETSIRMLRAHSQQTIMLDVDTSNERALALYHSCGFEIKATYDYYNLIL